MKTDSNRLKKVMAEVFGVKEEDINQNTSVDTLENWTSLNHMNLILALEEEFDISLSEDHTIEILNYPLIVEILKEYNIELD
jgi:acyl carrier protein